MIYKRHPDIAWREIVDEALAVDPRTGKVYPLNPVATFIWKRLDGKAPIQEIERELEQEFAAPREEVACDLEEFMAMLESQKMVERL